MKGFFDLQRFVTPLYGTDNSEYLKVTEAETVVYAKGGHDTVYNYSHDNVTILGGEGNDSLMSYSSSNSSIFGGNGNDKIYSTGANATLIGGSDNDSIHNDGDSATIFGGSGDDSISAYGDNLTISGGTGKDRISLSSYYSSAIIKYSSGDGYDTIINFNSNDTLQIAGGSYTTSESGNNVIVKVGSGSITLADAKGKTLNIKGVSGGGGNGKGKVITNYTDGEFIVGSSKGDSVYNYASEVTISTGKGNDTITNFLYNSSINSGSGNDSIGLGTGGYITVKAGTGSDTIIGTPSHSKIYGEKGNDFIHAGNGESYVTVKGGSGKDTISVYCNYSVFEGGKGNDKITLSLDSYNNVVKYAKGDGKDTVVGFNSDDTLHITKGSYKVSTKNNDVIVKVGSGSITLKDAKGQQISIKNSKGKVTTKTYGSTNSNVAELFAENNFATADNLSEIVKNDLSPTDYKVETQNFETLTVKNNLITFADK